jgi:signal transduction histidine kinase
LLALGLTALGLFILTLNLSDPKVDIYDRWVEVAVTAAPFSIVGAVVASRCPKNPFGWLYCAVGLVGGIRFFSAQYAAYALLAAPGSLPGGEVAAWILSWIWLPHIGLFAFSALMFPNGLLPHTRWRHFALFSGAVFAIGSIPVAFSPGPVVGFNSVDNPLGVEAMRGITSLVRVLGYTLVLVAVISLFVRLRCTRGIEQQQIKWVTYASMVGASGAILLYVVSPNTSVPWLSWISFAILLIGLVGLPFFMGNAILRYRLFDIDVIINRTLVYGSLSASVIGLYALLVGGLGALFQSQGNFAISLAATGLVAVLVQPIRNYLQCGVNRLLYGERDEPYKVLSRLGRRLETTLAPDAVVSTMVETVAQALKLPYAAITLKQEDGGFETAAEYGTPVSEPVVLPLTYQRKSVGQLVLAPRAPGEKFSTSDRRLLEDLARQTGVAVHAVRLTADLQRSREQLVKAREEERRRLRRDLHDGLGPQLASVTMRAEAARDLITNDPARAQEMMEGLAKQAQAAVADVRRLVYALRPPALDALGLIGALRSQMVHQEHNGLFIAIHGPEELPALPAAVEVAAYRIALEALTNVVRHAEARNCMVRLGMNEKLNELRLEVEDDGRGIEENRRAGVGLTSMRERAEELGGSCTVEAVPSGGTRVRAFLPYAHDDVIKGEAGEPTRKET